MLKSLFPARKELYKWVEKQIKFPKSDAQGYLFRYSTAALYSIIPSFVVITASNGDPGVSRLIFLLSALLTVMIAGAGAGAIVLVSGAIITCIVFSTQLTSPTFITSLAMYMIIGLLFGVIIDWAKRINLLKEFNKREKNYQKKVKEFEMENLKAQKEIKIRDEFLSIASHELKTPLTSTLLKLQTALNNIKNVSLADFSVQKLLEMLESAEQQTKRLSRMISDLLNVSIIRTGRLDLEFEETDLMQTVREVVNSFSERAEKEGVELNLDADGKIKAVIDKVRISQVITNLISNALKYGSSNPIDIKVYRGNSMGKIVVEDHGIGIPSNQQDKIFTLFERVNNNNYKGLGIGLYISQQIVKSHKGKLTVESRPGKGSVFTVEVPLKK